MEHESQSLRRRSVRNLRRSSGFFAVPCITEVAAINSEVSSGPETYGSIWLTEEVPERGNLRNSGQEKANNCATADASGISQLFKEPSASSQPWQECTAQCIGTSGCNETSSTVEANESPQRQPYGGHDSLQASCVWATRLDTSHSPTAQRTQPLNQSSLSCELSAQRGVALSLEVKDNICYLSGNMEHVGNDGCYKYGTAVESFPDKMTDPTAYDIYTHSTVIESCPVTKTDTTTCGIYTYSTAIESCPVKKTDTTACGISNQSVHNKENADIHNNAFIQVFSKFKSYGRKTVASANRTDSKTAGGTNRKKHGLTELLYEMNYKNITGSGKSTIGAKNRWRKSDGAKSLSVQFSNGEPTRKKRLSLNKNPDVISKILKCKGDKVVENDHSKKHLVTNVKLGQSKMSNQAAKVTHVSHPQVGNREDQEHFDFVVNNTSKTEINNIEFSTEDFCFPEFQLDTRTPKTKSSRRCSRIFSLHEMPLEDYFEQPNISDSGQSNCSVPSPIKQVSAASTSSVLLEAKEDLSVEQEVTVTTNECRKEGKQLLTESYDGSEVIVIEDRDKIVQDFSNLMIEEQVWAGVKDNSNVAELKDASETNTFSQLPTRVNCGDDTHVPEKSVQDIIGLEAGWGEAVLSLKPVLGEAACAVVLAINSEPVSVSSAFLADEPIAKLSRSSDVQALSHDVEMIELPTCDTNEDMEQEAVIEIRKYARTRRSRKSWDVSQSLTSDAKKLPSRRKERGVLSGKDPKNKTSASLVVPEDLMKDAAHALCTPGIELSHGATDNINVTSPVCNDPDDVATCLSPGLRSLYLNKNYVKPVIRSWETIKESPKSGQPAFLKQRHKCFLNFETSLTRVKLQRRHKKALEVASTQRIPQPIPISHEEFEKKMLDVQLFIDSSTLVS